MPKSLHQASYRNEDMVSFMNAVKEVNSSPDLKSSIKQYNKKFEELKKKFTLSAKINMVLKEEN